MNDRYLGSFITRFTYGRKVDDFELELGDEIYIHTQQALRPGRWLTDPVPLCKACFPDDTQSY
jgi:hypothetical protein